MADSQLPDVSEVYDRIFKTDPLLLLEKNQSEFGDQILRNLLVGRSIASTDPTDVDLDKKKSRALFKQGNRKKIPAITGKLKLAYAALRLNRSPAKTLTLTKKQLSDLKTVTMVADGDFTRDRMGEEYANHKLASDELEGCVSSFANRLTIAAIGYRVSISRLPHRSFFEEELSPQPVSKKPVKLAKLPEEKGIEKLRRTELETRKRYTRWRDAILRHIKQAFERHAHLVILPEFSLPPDGPLPGLGIEAAIRDIAKKFRNQFFLFSGSRHEGSYNRGFILSRQGGKKKVTDTWWHYKVASARGLGENIMGPQTSKLPGYNFKLQYQPGGEPVDYRMFLAICYDVFDTTTFINYVVQCVQSDGSMKESIILVPSFNPGKEFVHALRDLSFIASCPVIYVNGLHGDARLFLYGIAIADLVTIESKGLPDQSPEVSRFDKYLGETLQHLTDAIEETKRQFRSAEAASKIGQDELLQRRLQELARERFRRQKMLEGRRNVLEHFRNDLEDLRKDGALRHLITTEHCVECKGAAHAEGDYCANDVLYYNIDPRLMRRLKSFREEYFVNDEFLPSPFRSTEKGKIYDRIEEKRIQRQGR